MIESDTLVKIQQGHRRSNIMRAEMVLRIMELNDGRWKFDLKTKMSDDEIRKLLGRLKYVENRLKESMKIEIIKVTDTVEFIKKRNDA
jgi:hypothetical protein